MIDVIMPMLKYTSPPQYTSYSSYREYLRKTTKYKCAYCTLSESESPGATFNIDHFRPRKYFPRLSAECKNLRYACPRCNSYKRDLWIAEADGCNRDCETCKQHVCKKNIDRFVDQTQEDASKIMYLGDNDKIYPCKESFPAEYTIKYIRLNRKQLIKMRHVRKFMNNWFMELKMKREKAIIFLEDVKQKQLDFEKLKNLEDCNEKKSFIDIIDTMYEMMVIQGEQAVLFVDAEIRKLDYLTNQRLGGDDIITSK